MKQFLIALILLVPTAGHSLDSLVAGAPPTAYIQWLTHEGATMTQADGSTTANLAPYIGGNMMPLMAPPDQELFLGVMCNTLGGYQITLTATEGAATENSAKLVLGSGNELNVIVTLSKGTGFSGDSSSCSPHLSGSSPSIEVSSFGSESNLPLHPNAPNVWRISLRMPQFSSTASGLVKAGTYSGGLTATITPTP